MEDAFPLARKALRAALARSKGQGLLSHRHTDRGVAPRSIGARLGGASTPSDVTGV